MALRWCVCIVSVIIVVYVDPSIEEPSVKPLTPVKPSYSSDITDITDIEDDNDEVIHEREATMPGKPKWSSRKPDHETIARPAHSYVKMNCAAFGLPKPKIKWLFNGQSFERSVAGQWNMKGYKLTLRDLDPKDSGDYTCIVSNNFGSINWTYTLQVVQRLPHAPVIDGPRNQTVAVGEDAVFNCKIVLSDFYPHLQWLQHYKVNGSYTTPEGKPYVTVLQTSRVNISKPGQLILRNVTADMAGWYTCVVQNSIGIDYGSAWLTVVDA